MAIAEQLTRALDRLGIPITGVSIGDTNNRLTWRIDYLANVTLAQRTTAEAFKLTFDPDNDAQWTDDQAERMIDANKVSIALTVALWKQLIGRFPNASERSALRADAKTVWKTL